MNAQAVSPRVGISRARAWFLAARPKTLMASFVPVAVGAALAHREGPLDGFILVLTLVGAAAIQVGTNFWNDYRDHVQGADTAQRKGPTRAVAAGWISPRGMRAGAFWAFAVAGLVSCGLAVRGGWGFLLIAALGVLCGLWYTSGRYSLAYLGIAEPFVLIFFGPVAVAGTYYLQTLRVSLAAGIAGLAPGLLATALLAVNNLRDVNEDTAAGKKTPAVRFGTKAVRWEYTLCVLGATLVPVWLWFLGSLPHAALAVAGAMAVAIFPIAAVWRRGGKELNAVLGQTAGLLFWYGLCFSLACWIG